VLPLSKLNTKPDLCNGTDPIYAPQTSTNQTSPQVEIASNTNSASFNLLGDLDAGLVPTDKPGTEFYFLFHNAIP